MKVVEYVEPGCHDKVARMRISEAEAVRRQREVAATKNYEYASDAEALEDFLTVHWATVVELP